VDRGDDVRRFAFQAAACGNLAKRRGSSAGKLEGRVDGVSIEVITMFSIKNEKIIFKHGNPPH
jgi:hypothetical protein